MTPGPATQATNPLGGLGDAGLLRPVRIDRQQLARVSEQQVPTLDRGFGRQQALNAVPEMDRGPLRIPGNREQGEHLVSR